MSYQYTPSNLHQVLTRQTGKGNLYQNINHRRNQLKRYVERVDQRIGTVGKETAGLKAMLRLRAQIKAADSEKRKWYMKAYGLSLPELNNLGVRYMYRLKAAKEGRDFESCVNDIAARLDLRDKALKSLDSKRTIHPIGPRVGHT